MEFAMMDELVLRCKEQGIHCLKGYYYPTAKNGMVKDFYGIQGFTKAREEADGNTEWEFVIPAHYENKNRVIRVYGTDETGTL